MGAFVTLRRQYKVEFNFGRGGRADRPSGEYAVRSENGRI